MKMKSLLLIGLATASLVAGTAFAGTVAVAGNQAGSFSGAIAAIGVPTTATGLAADTSGGRTSRDVRRRRAGA